MNTTDDLEDPTFPPTAAEQVEEMRRLGRGLVDAMAAELFRGVAWVLRLVTRIVGGRDDG